MHAFQETAQYAICETPVEILQAEVTDQVKNALRALDALGGRIHPSYGQMAWLDDKIGQVQLVAQEANLTVSRVLYDRRNTLIKGVR